MTKTGSLFTATDELAAVIGPDLAKAFLDHRKALKKPMTPYAGQLMAKKLRGMPDPVAAVEQSILKGWTDVWPVDQPSGTVKSTSKPTMAALFGEMEEFFDGSERQAGSDQAAQGTLLGLPFDGRKH